MLDLISDQDLTINKATDKINSIKFSTEDMKTKVEHMIAQV